MNQFPNKAMVSLTVMTLTTLMSGCGGSGSSEERGAFAATPTSAEATATESKATKASVTASASAITSSAASVASAAAPWSATDLELAMADPPAHYFYDHEESGAPRTYRNDLSGDLTGEVQFVQSHSVAPSGNGVRNMPTPVALREAMVLLIGSAALATADSTKDAVVVTATRQGQVLGSLRMKPPALLPRSDNTMAGPPTRGDVAYSSSAWSAVLPYEWMRPDLSLTFTYTPQTGAVASGTLAADHIEFAPPTELVLQHIRLGMLTPPNLETGYLKKNPELGGSDYFSTIPIAKMIVAQYEDKQLDRVIVTTGGGAIYTVANPSPMNGGAFDGDMRDDVAGDQVARGITLANYGIVDSRIHGDSSETFNQRGIHLSRGLYANGVQGHGRSGGAGIATLFESNDGEFSHEVGHSYGLGHYPGETENVKNPVHHADSGWGWIGWRHRMRGNLNWNGSFDPAGTVHYPGNFLGIYNYFADAMSGGGGFSLFSNYSYYTGYSAKIIQDYLNTALTGGPRAVPDVSYPSGWRGWDSATGQWVDRQTLRPAFTAPRPTAVGIPVVTLLGGYQTTNSALNLVYPGFFGNWGVTYEYAPPPDTGPACWLEVTFPTEAAMKVALTSSVAGDPPRKFHINVALDRHPSTASIKCRDSAGASATFSTEAVGHPAGELVAPTVIGEEHGYSALRSVELSKLQKSLPPKKIGDSFTVEELHLIDAWEDGLPSLKGTAALLVQDFVSRRTKARQLSAYVHQHPSLMTVPSSGSTLEDFRALANSLDMLDARGRLRIPDSAPFRLNTDQSCITLTNSSGILPTLTRRYSTACNTDPDQRWFIDGLGRIRNAGRPDVCIRTSGVIYSLFQAEPCALKKPQFFVQHDIGRIESLGFPGFSMTADNPIALVGNEAHPNKNWSRLPRNREAVWTLLSSDVVRSLTTQFP